MHNQGFYHRDLTIKQPLVSIVTPSYNQVAFLEHTIQSVLDQDYPDIEYIVIDGGSTDGSVDTIKKYEGRLAYWVSEPDRGQSHAINKGWQRATGEIVAYLNSDDLYAPGAITAAVRTLTSNPDACMVYGDVLVVDEHGQFLRPLRGRRFDIRRQLVTEGLVPQPTAFIRRQSLDSVGLLDESLHLVMDYDLWIRLGLQYSIMYVPGSYWAKFREHTSAKSTASMARFPLERQRVLQKVFAKPHLPSVIQELRRDACAGISLERAKLALHAGQPQLILQPLLRGVVESPSFIARAPLAYYLFLRGMLPWWKGSPSRAAGEMFRLVQGMRGKSNASH